MSDPTAPLEAFIKKIFASLDASLSSISPPPASPEQYIAHFVPQLKQTSPVIVNGSPIAGKGPFQASWVKSPLTQHSLTSYDGHAMPPNGQLMVVNCSAKVRFDESGRNRMGETADLPQVVGAASTGPARPSWGDWFGVNLTFIVDLPSLKANDMGECIESLNWRCTYKPESSVVSM